MDIRQALITGTRDEFAHAVAGPEGWDRWVGGLTITDAGPGPIMAGIIGTLGVLIDPTQAGVLLHPHDSAEDALACFDQKMGPWVRRNSLMVDPRSHGESIDVDADELLALPVRSNDQTAAPFWI